MPAELHPDNAVVVPPVLRGSRFLKAMLCLQVMFNAVLFGVLILPGFFKAGALDEIPCCFCNVLTWGFTGIFSLLLMRDISVMSARDSRGARRLGGMVYLTQAFESVILLRLSLERSLHASGEAQVYIRIIAGVGLVLSIATLVALVAFAAANSVPPRPPRPRPPTPDPEDFQTSGAWDEAKNDPPKADAD